MKPLHLTLRAFGSYAGELSIDFARLGRHGIFAICGPTGAGKSTIFDAIVYALYDDLPGFRVDGSIRSQYADVNTPTEVCFEFEVHGEQWRIERGPTQPVPRQRGSGEPITKQSTVVLSRVGVDGVRLSRKGDVAAKVVDLVGLTKDQFEQVVLIPQGRFEEVLKAETNRRAPLLRQLFPVEIFTGVTEALRTTATGRKEVFDEAARRHEGFVEHARKALAGVVEQLPEAIPSPIGEEELTPEGFDENRISQHLARVEEVVSAVEGLVRTAESALENARDKRDATVEAESRWSSWQANLTEAAEFPAQEEDDEEERVLLDRAITLEALAATLEHWEESADRLSELDIERAQLRKALDAAWDADYETSALEEAGIAQALADRIGRDAEALERADEEFQRLSGEEEELFSLRQRLDRNVGELEATRCELAERGTALAEAEAKVKELREQAQGTDGLADTVRALEEELIRVDTRDQADRKIVRIDADLGPARERAERLAAEAVAVRLAWRHGLAGRLAQELVDGEPCPTCGALEHPDPAALQSGAPGDEDLEGAEAAARKAEELVHQLERERSGQVGQRDALVATRGRAEVEAELGSHRVRLQEAREAEHRLEKAVTSVEYETAALEADRERAEATRGTLAEKEGAFRERSKRFEVDRAAFFAAHGAFASMASAAAARRSLATQVRAFHNLLVQLATEQAVHGQLRATLEPAVARFGVDGPAALFAWRLSEDEIGTRQKALGQRRDHRNEILAKIKEYEESGASRTRPDPEPLESALETATNLHETLVGRRAVIETGASELRGMPARLAAATAEVARSRSSFEQARTVAELCAGASAGPVHTRLSLENWVLADYLRQVLHQANGRLATMTGGRYALQLSDGQIDGRKQWGLELDAFDVFTGQTRPVRTLSGGETFMAALALALGLADVVSGGSNRDLGALFVDEGFGSLDPQSLDAVVEVLRSLEDGGRIVGVISHVEELKQALPTGITVTASNAGSKAEVHYPPD